MSQLKWPQIILFGDSLTQYTFGVDSNFGGILAHKLARKCDVLNRGFSGYNTRWNKIILPRIITKEMAPDIAAVTIFLGANDSNKLELNPRQHVPVEEYKQNLVDMVNYLNSIGISKEKIILIAPPPCNEEAWFAVGDKLDPPRPHSKCNAMAEDYAAKCVEAAEVTRTHVVHLYTEMSKHQNWKEFLGDGLHLSKQGGEFLEKLLWPIIEKLTKDLPIICPIHDQVDYNNPESSLLNC